MTAHIKHLVIAGLFAAVVLVAAWKYFAYAGNLAHDQKILAEETLKQDLDKAKIQATATKADNLALQGQLNALQASNAALARDLASLRAQLSNQRQADAAMPPDALSLRWSELISAPGQVQPSVGGFNVTLQAGHETVSQLEELPVLKAEKAQIEATGALKDAALVQAQKTLGSTAEELGTCQKLIIDGDAVCKAKIAEVKASAKKRGFWVALGSFLAGVLAGHRI